MSSCLRLWRESQQVSRSLHVNTFKNESWSRVCMSRTGWWNFVYSELAGQVIDHMVIVTSRHVRRLSTVVQHKGTDHLGDSGYHLRFRRYGSLTRTVPVGMQRQMLVESGDPTCPPHRKDQRSDIRVVPPSTNHLGSTEDGEGTCPLSILVERLTCKNGRQRQVPSIRKVQTAVKFTKSGSLAELWTYQLYRRGTFLVHRLLRRTRKYRKPRRYHGSSASI